MILPIKTLFNRPGVIPGGVPTDQAASFLITGDNAGQLDPSAGPGPLSVQLPGWSDSDHIPEPIDDSGAAPALDSSGRPQLVLQAGYPAWRGDRQRVVDIRSRDRWGQAGGEGGRRPCGVSGLGDQALDYLLEGGMNIAENLSVRPGTLVQRGPNGELIYSQPLGSQTNLPIVAGQVALTGSAVSNPAGAGLVLGLAAVAGVVLVFALRRGR